MVVKIATKVGRARIWEGENLGGEEIVLRLHVKSLGQRNAGNVRGEILPQD